MHAGSRLFSVSKADSVEFVASVAHPGVEVDYRFRDLCSESSALLKLSLMAA